MHSLADADEAAGADIRGGRSGNLRIVRNDSDGVTFVSTCAADEVREGAIVEIEVAGQRDDGLVVRARRAAQPGGAVGGIIILMVAGRIGIFKNAIAKTAVSSLDKH